MKQFKDPCAHCSGDCPASKCPSVINVPLEEVKKPSVWARTPTFYKAAILAALWFLFVYLPSLGLK